MRQAVLLAPETCFFERDPSVALLRRATVEGVGTLLLMVAATGSGLTVQHAATSAGIPGLLAGALATAGALVGLIIAFGPVSGGHFNPLITLLQWLGRERTLACTAAYVVAQFVGAAAGAVLAHALFAAGVRAVVYAPATGTLLASEVLAASGLMLIVFGCARSGRADVGPFAVGAWLMAAIIATPSTSYANPAITLAAVIASGPIALSGARALLYVAAEAAGALFAFAIVAMAYPRSRKETATRLAISVMGPPS